MKRHCQVAQCLNGSNSAFLSFCVGVETFLTIYQTWLPISADCYAFISSAEIGYHMCTEASFALLQVLYKGKVKIACVLQLLCRAVTSPMFRCYKSMHTPRLRAALVIAQSTSNILFYTSIFPFRYPLNQPKYRLSAPDYPSERRLGAFTCIIVVIK